MTLSSVFLGGFLTQMNTLVGCEGSLWIYEKPHQEVYQEVHLVKRASGSKQFSYLDNWHSILITQVPTCQSGGLEFG